MLPIRKYNVTDLIEIIKKIKNDSSHPTSNEQIENSASSVNAYTVIKNFSKDDLEGLKTPRKPYFLWSENLENGNYVVLAGFLEKKAFLNCLIPETKFLLSLVKTNEQIQSDLYRLIFNMHKYLANNKYKEVEKNVNLEEDKKNYFFKELLNIFTNCYEKKIVSVNVCEIFKNLLNFPSLNYQEHMEQIIFNLKYPGPSDNENKMYIDIIRSLRQENRIETSDLINRKLGKFINNMDNNTKKEKFDFSQFFLNQFELLSKAGYKLNAHELVNNEKNIVEFILENASSKVVATILPYVDKFPSNKSVSYYEENIQNHLKDISYGETIKQAYVQLIKNHFENSIKHKEEQKSLKKKI